jgi:hypothetical protein
MSLTSFEYIQAMGLVLRLPMHSSYSCNYILQRSSCGLHDFAKLPDLLLLKERLHTNHTGDDSLLTNPVDRLPMLRDALEVVVVLRPDCSKSLMLCLCPPNVLRPVTDVHNIRLTQQMKLAERSAAARTTEAVEAVGGGVHVVEVGVRRERVEKDTHIVDLEAIGGQSGRGKVDGLTGRVCAGSFHDRGRDVGGHVGRKSLLGRRFEPGIESVTWSQIEFESIQARCS